MSEYELMIQQSKFGEASKKVVVEEFLDGIEMSVFILTDGENYIVLPQAKDYKRILAGDKGANTGGMGAVSPVPFADKSFMQKVNDLIIVPTMNGLKQDNIAYSGIIFVGIIKVNDEPFVIEYNCRLGDPESEVIIPRMKNDLVDIFEATATGKLSEINLEEDHRVACTVMAVSAGYPGTYEKGHPITGLDFKVPGTMIFHAGTVEKDGQVLTNGGRVFCVTAFGESIDEAVQSAVDVMGEIDFDGITFRSDIGWEFR